MGVEGGRTGSVRGLDFPNPSWGDSVLTSPSGAFPLESQATTTMLTRARPSFSDFIYSLIFNMESDTTAASCRFEPVLQLPGVGRSQAGLTR